MVGLHHAHQILGDFGEADGGGDRLIDGDRAGDGAHVAEADARRDGVAVPGFHPEPRGDAIGEMVQGRAVDALDERLLAERRLGSGGAGALVGDDAARVAVPAEGAEFFASGMAEDALHPFGALLGELADGEDTLVLEFALGDRADAPHQPDRQRMQEFQLA